MQAVGTLDLARTDGQACRQSTFVIQKWSAIGDISKAGTDRGLRVGDVSLFEERPQTFQNLRPAIVFQPVLLFLPPGRLILGSLAQAFSLMPSIVSILAFSLGYSFSLSSKVALLETELFSISEKRPAMGSP